MKYIITSLIAILAPLTLFAMIDTNLAYNSSGNAVYELQDVLISDGCLTHEPTGYFGLLTLNAVKCFQIANNIPSTGYVGVLTRTVLNAIIASNVETSTQAQQEEIGTTTQVVTTPIEPVVKGIPETPVSKTSTSKEVIGADGKIYIEITQPVVDQSTLSPELRAKWEKLKKDEPAIKAYQEMMKQRMINENAPN
jgi:peptidoglycan hydrolase-like protein with peptidoglycan-binding domain